MKATTAPRPVIDREYIEKHPQPQFGNVRRRVTVKAISDRQVVCPGGSMTASDGTEIRTVLTFDRAHFAATFDGEFVDELGGREL